MASTNCESILIVEDDTEIRESLQELLELDGYKVFTANNGQEAIDSLQSMPHPCLILLDMMMPVMNGWAFLEHRRSHDLLAIIPVIIVSAATETRLSGLETQGIVKKPIDLDVLLKWIKQYCT